MKNKKIKNSIPNKISKVNKSMFGIQKFTRKPVHPIL